MKNTLFLLLAAMCTLMIACQPPATTTEPAEVDLDSARAEIQALEDAYAKASNEKNVDAILAYYADDAQRLPDDGQIIKGKDALRKQIAEELASDTTGASVKFQVLDIYADGDLLVEVGSSVTTAKDGSEKNRGKYVAVYEKRDGKYVCILDIWNDDAKDNE